MEEEDNIIVKWAQEDVETSYNLLNKYYYYYYYYYYSGAFSCFDKHIYVSTSTLIPPVCLLV